MTDKVNKMASIPIKENIRAEFLTFIQSVRASNNWTQIDFSQTDALKVLLDIAAEPEIINAIGEDCKKDDFSFFAVKKSIIEEFDMLTLEIEEWADNSEKEIKVERSTVLKLLLKLAERQDAKKVIKKIIGVPVEEEPQKYVPPPQKQPEMTIEQTVRSLIERIDKKIENHRAEIERSETMQSTLKDAVEFFHDEENKS